MQQIHLYEIIELLTSNMLSFADSGRMSREGITYTQTPYEITAVYNTAQLPYIIYQEKGFTHYRSGKFIDVNKGFISVKANGKIERLIHSKLLDIPYNNLEDNQIILENNSLMMTQLGVMKDV